MTKQLRAKPPSQVIGIVNTVDDVRHVPLVTYHINPAGAVTIEYSNRPPIQMIGSPQFGLWRIAQSILRHATNDERIVTRNWHAFWSILVEHQGTDWSITQADIREWVTDRNPTWLKRIS